MKSTATSAPARKRSPSATFYTALAALQSAEECRAFLRDLCTPAEIQAMADRWSVVEHLPARASLSGNPSPDRGQRNHYRPRGRFLASGNGGYESSRETID